MEVKNMFVSFENGDNCLVYTEELTEDEVKRFAEKATSQSVIDIYCVPQEELQYYCINDRVWLETPEKAESVRKYIAS